MSAFDKKKTVTDLQHVDLLEKDYALRQAKFTAFYQAEGDMALFNESFFWWKKSFRAFYDEDYIRKSGFLPETEVTLTNFNEPELLTYLQTLNADIDSIYSYNKGIPESNDVARLYIQDNAYDFSNSTGILTENVEVEPGVFRDNFYREMASTWVDEDELEVTITFTDGYYINDVPPVNPEDPAIGEEVPIADKIVVASNVYQFTECIIVKVEYLSDPDPEWFIVIDEWVNVPVDVYETVDLIMTAIIPIKENNIFTEETLFLKRFLNKLGLGGRQLIDSLTITDGGAPSPVDNAYIVEGLPFNSTDQSVIKTLFKSFQYLSVDGTGDRINLSMESLSMTYQFTVDIQTTNTDLDEGVDNKNRPIYAVSELTGSNTLIIKYQEIPGEYYTMTVTNYKQTYQIFSEGKIRYFIATLDSEEDVGRLLLPLSVLNDLKFREYVPVHEHAFCMIAYAIETTTIKWYERIAGFVLGIILGVIFGPAGMTLYQLILNAVINAVIGLAISFVLAAIDNPWVAAIVGIVAAIYGQLGNLDLSNLTAENFLPLAKEVIDGASGIYADHIKEEMKKVQEEAEAQQKKDEELLESMKPGIDIPKLLRDTMYSFENSSSPELWIEGQLGQGLFNFDQYYDVTKEITIRKSVVAG